MREHIWIMYNFSSYEMTCMRDLLNNVDDTVVVVAGPDSRAPNLQKATGVSHRWTPQNTATRGTKQDT